MTITDKIFNYLRNTQLAKKLNFNKFAFYFLYKLKSQNSQFKIKIQTKCLVLSHYIGAETRALGGLIAQYPKNFEVLAFTNGSNMIKDLSQIESSNIKKQQFADVMKLSRVKGFKAFDINSGTLIEHYNKFKKIDISEVDYIFVPNAYDPNPDARALLEHFRKLLKTKEYKKDLQILMYESDYPLAYIDYWANISNISQTKYQMLKVYYPTEGEQKLIEGIMGLNKFRAVPLNSSHVEGFMSFNVAEFLRIPFV